jgi:hypothetical protein
LFIEETGSGQNGQLSIIVGPMLAAYHNPCAGVALCGAKRFMNGLPPPGPEGQMNAGNTTVLAIVAFWGVFRKFPSRSIESTTVDNSRNGKIITAQLKPFCVQQSGVPDGNVLCVPS